MTERLHNRVRSARIDTGLTQRELAERVGTARKTVNLLETRSVAPSVTLALRLARELGTTVDRLFWVEDDAIGTARGREANVGVEMLSEEKRRRYRAALRNVA